jgi:hypothetical protein
MSAKVSHVSEPGRDARLLDGDKPKSATCAQIEQNAPVFYALKARGADPDHGLRRRFIAPSQTGLPAQSSGLAASEQGFATMATETVKPLAPAGAIE